MKGIKMEFGKRKEIMRIAEGAGLVVDFDPLGTTELTLDERLVVHAPLYPFVGKKALQESVRVVDEDLPALRNAQSRYSYINALRRRTN
jgi:hypothetical protein